MAYCDLCNTDVFVDISDKVDSVKKTLHQNAENNSNLVEDEVTSDAMTPMSNIAARSISDE
jgi:hypothetical protein